MIRMGLFLIVLTMLSLFVISVPVQAAEKGGIMVWRLVPKEGVTEKNIDSITGFLTTQVELRSGMKVFSEEDMKSIVEGEEKKQLCGGDNTTVCIAEIGAAMGVPEAISGDLGRVGSFWMLNLRHINVRRAEVLTRVSRQIEGSVDDLIRAIPGAVAEIFGEKVKPPPVAKIEKPAEEPAEKPVVEKEAEKGMGKYQIAAYATFFSGVGLVAFGGLGTWQAVSATEAVNDKRSKNQDASDDESSRSGWLASSYAFYGIGGALVITGATLWIIDSVRENPAASEEMDDEKKDSDLSFGISPAPGGASASVGWKW